MPLTEAKKKNKQTTNASNFYRGTEVEVWENLLRQWDEDWITSYMAEKQAQSMYFLINLF
jgi:hypothetical protein